MKPSGTRRERGAYYTPAPLARRMAVWGVREPDEIVLDPAAGRGALLLAAHDRLREIGRPSGGTLYGVELHAKTHKHLRSVGRGLAIPAANLARGDFFRVGHKLPSPDVILMNPPFVRHHDIPVRAHARMRASTREIGSILNGRASSWAYFLLHSAAMLKVGGRLGAILPLDLLGASYARDVLRFFDERFARSEVSVEDDGHFEGLQVRVVLLFADGYRGPPSSGCRPSLTNGLLSTKQTARTPQILDGWRSNGRTASKEVLRAHALLTEYEASGCLRRLKDQASVAIGYVAGDSPFFHLTDEERHALRIDSDELVRVVRGARFVAGSAFREKDWNGLRASGSACWLFRPGDVRSEAALSYLKARRSKAARGRATCLKRNPWWQVELGTRPSAFILYSAAIPRIVANLANAWASNALYVARCQLGHCGPDLALSSLTSVAQLDMRSAGRELGGGLRKLDVGDVQELRIPDVVGVGLQAEEVDGLVRAGAFDPATQLADEFILRGTLGWSSKEVGRVQSLCKKLCAHSGVR